MRGVFANRWWVVVATVLALIVGAGPINVFSFGVFLKPITAELGIGRGTFSIALTAHSTIGALSCPLMGWMIDRWGVRRCMVPGTVLYAASIAAYSLITADPFALTILLFAVTGWTSPFGGPIPFSTVIAQWFDRQRGLALGIGMAGVGLGVAMMPQLAGLLIAQFGWRGAYVGMGIAVMIAAFIPVALFVREPPDFAARPERGQSRGAALNLPGVEVGAAFRSGLFWALGMAFFLDVIAINGTLTHIVPLLTDRGIAREVAITAMSGTGIALLVGRVLSGWFLDRFWGPYVAIGFFTMPMIGLVLLMSQAGGAVPFLGAIFCGLGIGAEIDLMAFFVSRYFGLKNYAKIYGTMFGLFGLGVGIGPALSGFSFDRFHSYTPIFVLYVIMLFVTCVIFLRLGPYPYPAGRHAAAGAPATAPA
ncbi:MAG TPA: MFS transporter [Stellaceae bacterium]|jgi:MFS family permease|nr:MFS transporter [Stellaceae bacterium]